MKKILLGLGTLGIALAVLPMFAAFEAHVVNVKATIENAMTVSSNALDFGTVFPQEAIDKTLNVGLSDSFVADQNRTNPVDTVAYMIRQKPKCGVVLHQSTGPGDPTTYSSHPQVTEVQGNFVCPQGSVELPLLCSYLSKHEGTDDDPAADVQENDGPGINAFHGLPGPWNLATTVATQVTGQLQKLIDPSDTWTIDLKVPCFTGSCAQDWAAFVTNPQTGNPTANPNDYMADPNLEHQTFGCDLWLETTGITQTPPPVLPES